MAALLSSWPSRFSQSHHLQEMNPWALPANVRLHPRTNISPTLGCQEDFLSLAFSSSGNISSCTAHCTHESCNLFDTVATSGKWFEVKHTHYNTNDPVTEGTCKRKQKDTSRKTIQLTISVKKRQTQTIADNDQHKLLYLHVSSISRNSPNRCMSISSAKMLESVTFN